MTSHTFVTRRVPVPHPGDVHDHVERRCDLLPDRADRKLDAAHQRHRLDPGERVTRAVRVDRRERAVVARVHRLEHVERLRAACLTDDHPVGPHAQRVAHELADLDLALALDVRRAGLERAHVLLREPELLGVLDRHDAVVVGNERRHDVQERRLPGAGSARDHRVELPANARVEKVRDLRRQRPEVDEIVDGVGLLREPADRQERTADRHRVDHRVDARAVEQSGVDHRRRLVDAPADLADDLVDRPAQVVLVDELDIGALELAAPLDVDHLRAVHHDFGDARVVQEAVDRAVAERVVGDVLDQLRTLGGRERGVLLAQRLVHLLLHEAAELVGLDIVVGELRADLVDHELVDAQAQLLELSSPRRSPRLPSANPASGSTAATWRATSCSLIGASRDDAARLTPRARPLPGPDPELSSGPPAFGARARPATAACRARPARRD